MITESSFAKVSYTLKEQTSSSKLDLIHASIIKTFKDLFFHTFFQVEVLQCQAKTSLTSSTGFSFAKYQLMCTGSKAGRE